jgi:hypothetical protein
MILNNDYKFDVKVVSTKSLKELKIEYQNRLKRVKAIQKEWDDLDQAYKELDNE